MKILSFLLFLLCICAAQDASTSRGRHPSDDPEMDAKIARTQRTALIKADHKQNVEDAAELVRLAEAVRTELDKEDPYVISAKTLKQTEDIEKLAKSIHGRLKRY